MIPARVEDGVFVTAEGGHGSPAAEGRDQAGEGKDALVVFAGLGEFPCNNLSHIEFYAKHNRAKCVLDGVVINILKGFHQLVDAGLIFRQVVRTSGLPVAISQSLACLSNAKLLEDRFGHQIDACTRITQGLGVVVIPNGAWYGEAPRVCLLAGTLLCIMARNASMVAAVSNSPILIFLDTMSLRNLA
ncbi:hypothetical protein V6N13_109715 [Hibiscus sabdariffa]